MDNTLSEQISQATRGTDEFKGLIYARPMSASVKQQPLAAGGIGNYISFKNMSGELAFNTLFLDSVKDAVMLARALNTGNGVFIEFLDEESFEKLTTPTSNTQQ